VDLFELVGFVEDDVKLVVHAGEGVGHDRQSLTCGAWLIGGGGGGVGGVEDERMK
jgi:hypothetical protein